MGRFLHAHCQTYPTVPQYKHGRGNLSHKKQIYRTDECATSANTHRSKSLRNDLHRTAGDRGGISSANRLTRSRRMNSGRLAVFFERLKVRSEGGAARASAAGGFGDVSKDACEFLCSMPLTPRILSNK